MKAPLFFKVAPSSKRLTAGRPVKVSFLERKVSLCHVPEANDFGTCLSSPQGKFHRFELWWALRAFRLYRHNFESSQASFRWKRPVRFLNYFWSHIQSWLNQNAVLVAPRGLAKT